MVRAFGHAAEIIAAAEIDGIDCTVIADIFLMNLQLPYGIEGPINMAET